MKADGITKILLKANELIGQEGPVEFMESPIFDVLTQFVEKEFKDMMENRQVVTIKFASGVLWLAMESPSMFDPGYIPHASVGYSEKTGERPRTKNTTLIKINPEEPKKVILVETT